MRLYSACASLSRGGCVAIVIFFVAAAVVINALFWRSDATPAIADAVIQRTSPEPVGDRHRPAQPGLGTTGCAEWLQAAYGAGTCQSEKGVRSLVALKLRDHTTLLEGLRVSSKDFR